jgi:hypothetical protein
MVLGDGAAQKRLTGGARAPGDSLRDKLSSGLAAAGRSGPSRPQKSVYVDAGAGRNLRCAIAPRKNVVVESKV